MMPEDLEAMMEAAGAMDAGQLTLVSEALEPYVFSYGSPDGVEGQVDMLRIWKPGKERSGSDGERSREMRVRRYLPQ